MSLSCGEARGLNALDLIRFYHVTIPGHLAAFY